MMGLTEASLSLWIYKSMLKKHYIGRNKMTITREIVMTTETGRK